MMDVSEKNLEKKNRNRREARESKRGKKDRVKLKYLGFFGVAFSRPDIFLSLIRVSIPIWIILLKEFMNKRGH